MFQFIKTASALFGALLGFWLGTSMAKFLGFESKLPFMIFAMLGASFCAVLYIVVFHRLFQSKQATGKFDLKQLALAVLLAGFSGAALVFTLPIF
ncbi:MAG: hypothetical protein ACRCWR_12510 [Saezia sp.]